MTPEQFAEIAARVAAYPNTPPYYGQHTAQQDAATLLQAYKSLKSFLDLADAEIGDLKALREAAPSVLMLSEEERAGYLEVLLALEDLSFECFSPFATSSGHANAPTAATYNRAFDVLDRHRKQLNVTSVKTALASRSAK